MSPPREGQVEASQRTVSTDNGRRGTRNLLLCTSQDTHSKLRLEPAAIIEHTQHSVGTVMYSVYFLTSSTLCIAYAHQQP